MPLAEGADVTTMMLRAGVLALGLFLHGFDARADDQFCLALKQVIADGAEGFERIRIEPKEGSWEAMLGVSRSRVQLPGMENCRITEFDLADEDDYFFTCDVPARTQAASEEGMARLAKAVAACLPAQSGRPGTNDENMPSIDFGASSNGVSVGLYVSEVANSYSTTLMVEMP